MEETKDELELITQFFADFSDSQMAQFRELKPLYLEWNQKINVISRKDIQSLYEKHVLHSLSIAAAFRFAPGDIVLDIGTGGGFPGIPLAIYFPETQFHLVDSIGKKIKVVGEIVQSLGLKNVKAFHQRVEEIQHQKYQAAVSRAVAPLFSLWTWARPLLKKDRVAAPIPLEKGPVLARGLLCLKGGDLHQEISESRCRPKVMEIYDLFPLEFFREKYLLYTPA